MMQAVDALPEASIPPGFPRINSCIYLSPANRGHSGVEMHFRFRCYRNPYLGSGMIRGIGPVYARKLVRAFGDAVFERIELQPERLRDVAGIGPKRAARIVAGWAEQKVIRLSWSR
jgi:Helix-hairpin-helix domain